ncbi:MAG: hypothetical protein ACLPPF_21390 [Rhodomicrobium sp.]
MKPKKIVYAALALFALVHAAPAETTQNCSDKFNLEGILGQYQKAAKDGPVSINPVIRRLLSDVTKSFVCQSLVNYYAQQNGAPDDVVRSETVTRDNINEVTFSSKRHPNLCGAIRMEVPLDIVTVGTTGNATTIERKAYRAMIEATFHDFIQTLPDAADEGGSVVSPYLPNGRELPKPSFETLIAIAQAFQSRLIEAYGKITAQNGWKDGDSQRLLSLIKCSPLLPEVSGPDMKFLANYPSAFEDYKRFEHDLDEAMK